MPRVTRRDTTRRAFSLVELLLVVSIIAVTAAVAAPRYANALARHRADAAANRLKSDLARTIELARASSRSYTVTFSTGSASYAIVPTSALGDLSRTSVVQLAPEPYLSRLKTADFGGDNAVVFNGFGIPDSGGQVDLASGNASYAVTLAANTGEVTVARTP